MAGGKAPSSHPATPLKTNPRPSCASSFGGRVPCPVSARHPLEGFHFIADGSVCKGCSVGLQAPRPRRPTVCC